MKLQANQLSWQAGRTPIVQDVSLEVAAGEFLGIIGPNGSGKSSLMALLAGIRPPASGDIRLDGQPILRFSRREVAQRVALVAQQADTAERITARQAVELGRTPYLGPLSPWSSADNVIVDTALMAVDMADKADRIWQTLSGGERQRLHIGRALAQQPDILLLDEPTNHLDIGHQISLLDLVHHKTRTEGLAVVAALHDLNQAMMFCDRLMVMNKGRVVAVGVPEEILTSSMIAEVFHATASIETHEDGGRFICYRRPMRQG